MIRKLESRDMERVLEIWLEASIKAHDFIDKSYWESQTENMRDIYIPASETFVIEESSRVLGFYSAIDRQLAALFVDPNHQGQGFGKRLLSHAKAQHAELTLTVYKENLPSIAFYQSQGFKLGDESVDEHTGHRQYVMVYKN